MDQLPLTVGILSWGQHKTLMNTINSYYERGLANKPEQIFIFFQEMTNADEELAELVDFDHYGADTNLGIAGGYAAMLEHVEQPNYLFLENDWVLTEDLWSGNTAIEDGIGFLEDDIADVVRYRSKRNPGNPLWTRQFQDRELTRPEHLMDSIHWIDNPSASFPEFITQIDHDWYRTTASFANWTNNPHMAKTEWLRQNILPRLGNRDIELDLQHWWQAQDFQVAQGSGLFTHYRIG